MINMNKVFELKRNKDINELLRQSEEELSNPNTKFLTQDEIIKSARRIIDAKYARDYGKII